jgi:hypothetical protein
MLLAVKWKGRHPAMTTRWGSAFWLLLQSCVLVIDERRRNLQLN